MKRSLFIFLAFFNCHFISAQINDTRTVINDTCVITEAQNNFASTHYNWFLFKISTVRILGKVDTSIFIGEKELSDSESISKRWIIDFVRARDWPEWYDDMPVTGKGFIKVIDSTGHTIMIYSLMSEGRQGDYYEYYPNGQLKVKGQYCDQCPGIAYGTWYYYDKKGVLLKQKKIKRIKCNHGEICE
jgi:hypothetical protein